MPSVDLRTRAERDAFGAATYYAAVHGLAAPPETAYLEALPGAREAVLRRLIRGLLRGSPAGLPEPVVLAEPDDADLDGGALPPGTEIDASDAPLAVLPFPSSESALVAPIAAVHGYDRFSFAGPAWLHAPGGRTRVDHPIDVADLLEREGAFSDDDQADRIRAELAESAANLALARLAARVQARRFQTGSALDPAADLPGADPAAALERTVTDGHPFHPSAKIRRGMSPTEGLSYAPEFAASIDLRFVAVRADRTLRASTGPALTDRLYDAFDGLQGAVERALPDDRARESYTVIPIHPWQYHRVVPDRYASQRAEGDVVAIDDYSRPATPLLNLRTVVPYSDDEALPHCKLAIGVQTTNVERTVSPQAVYNGPRVTAALHEVAAAEAFDHLGVLDEPTATCYYPPGGPHVEGDAYDDVRHLSGLVRSNPYDHPLVGDGRPVPTSSLIADSPATGRPLVREAIDRYADATDTTDRAEAAEAFVDAYAESVVPEQLFLLSKYGIALESHLQNSYVVLREGRPVATLVRDFGGVRVHHDRLADRGLSIETYPDSDLDADGEGDLYRKLYYALFQNHLAELIVAVVESTPAEEAALWGIVRGHAMDGFEAARADPAVPASRVDRDKRTLFGNRAVHKALTAMRLRGKRHEYVTSRVSNPLAPPPADRASETRHRPDTG